jgi:hypothetical protein
MLMRIMHWKECGKQVLMNYPDFGGSKDRN